MGAGIEAQMTERKRHKFLPRGGLLSIDIPDLLKKKGTTTIGAPFAALALVGKIADN